MGMIDKKKLLDWLEKMETPYLGSASHFDNGIVKAYMDLKKAIESGELNEDPNPVHEIGIGDKVTHVDVKEYGVGRVIEIARSGARAHVEFHPQSWGTHRAYYRLDKLRKVNS